MSRRVIVAVTVAVMPGRSTASAGRSIARTNRNVWVAGSGPLGKLLDPQAEAFPRHTREFGIAGHLPIFGFVGLRHKRHHDLRKIHRGFQMMTGHPD